MNDENLKKGKATQFKSGEQQAKIARKGGLASARSRKRKKSMTDLIKEFAERKVSDTGKFRDKLNELGIEDEDVTIGATLVLSIMASAIDGNAQNAKLALELLGVSLESPHKKEMDKALMKLREREIKSREEGW